MPVYSWPRRSYSPSETLLSLPNVRLSPFFRPAANGAVCTLCHRECRLYEGAVGACGMRFSHRERIYTAAYGLLSAAESRPMEIKPMYHFYPGTSALTISSWGCNFPCAWCQNWHLSKTAIWQGYFVPEEKVVAWAEKNGDAGINVSFNEPTLLGEYIIEVFKIARARGLHTSINTNGYFTEEVLRRFVDAGIEGMNIDIKGGKETYEHWLCAKFSRLKESAEKAIRANVHVEFTYLVIPGINDWEADEVIETVASFGRGTPLHITSYFPAHKLSNPPPDKELIEEIWMKAKRALDYVYVGNLQAHPGQNTYCPECGNAVIKRKGDRVLRFALNGRKCWHCGFEIEMRGLPGTYGKLYQGFLG